MENAPSTNALIDAAFASVSVGDLHAAEVVCRQLVAADPADARALALLGVMHQSAGRHDHAEALFAELVRREPHDAAHWVNLGTARRSLKRYDEALVAYARAAQLGETSADFFFNVGLTHLDRFDYESARAVLQLARRSAPRDAEVRVQFARVCELLLRNDEAVGALTDWADLDGLTGDGMATIAQLFFSLGEQTRGEEALSAALTRTDCTRQGLLVLAGTLERINRIGQAQQIMRRIDGLPDAGRADDVLLVRAQLAQRAADHEQARSLFNEVLSGCSEFPRRHLSLFPLARTLDALESYEEAFNALTEAHASQAAYLEMAAPLDALRGPPAMIVTDFGCNPQDVCDWDERDAPDALESPIFIVGFPRSGTTLLELTLDAHPFVRGMDEQPFVQNALDEILGLGVDYPRRLADLRGRELEDVRDRYLARAKRKAGLGPGDRLLDKNPLNILRLPVIRRLFPHARIVLMVRHPCDVLLSCFMQHFRSADFALLCQTLPSLAKGYRRTLDFWYEQCAVLAPSVYELRYERLVSHFDEEIESLCKFLGLSRDAAMLIPAEHARRKGYISTPSYAQVVQPINAQAVGRWTRYASHFQEVMPMIEPYLRRWSYGSVR